MNVFRLPAGNRDCPTVLFVDDNRDVCDSLAYLLRLEGFRVATAANGQEALDWLRDHPAPSVILLDLRMPIMDGTTLRRRLAQDPRLAAIPVIVCSALGDAEDAVLLEGVAAVYPKSGDPGLLVQLIREHASLPGPT